MDDGSWWDVPAKIIASSRASSLAQAADQSEFIDVFRHAYEETLTNEEMLIDWAESNLTWEEVHDFAKISRAPNVDNYTVGWKTGMKMIVKD